MYTVKLRSGRKRLGIGVRVPCRFVDGSHKICTIIKMRACEEETGRNMYYVHYDNYDKRLDRWAFEEEFDKTQIGTEKTDEELEGLLPSDDRKVTRAMKRRLDEIHHHSSPLHDPQLQKLEDKHNEVTKVKNVERIQFGRKWVVDCWYFSPYPKEIVPAGTLKLYICEFCLKYFGNDKLHRKHSCNVSHPPGEEIYKHENRSFWEVDGTKQKVYCQNLCLLAKLFLDHKTLYYDVEAFKFYVFTQKDETGIHMCGYFSKEKRSGLGYNLACIMILPPYQKQGWGKYLIHFSYQLSRLEGKVGTPEIPLSDLGKVSYHSYWRYICLKALEKRPNLQIADLSRLTSIKESDIITALQGLNLVKYWKKENVITANLNLVKEHLQGKRPIREIFYDQIRWQPPFGDDSTKKKKKK